MPSDATVTILRNTKLGHDNFLLEFAWPGAATRMGPAQFFMIGIPGSEVLLRRPFSVCGLPGTFQDAPDDAVQVLYKIVGKGTRLLASLERGAPLRVLGPLGRGFVPPEPPARAVFVAGGIGSAPFPAFAAQLAEGAAPPRMFYGARSAADLPLLEWFRERCEVEVTTDDGSVGSKNLVTAPLENLLRTADPRELHLYACGPDPMLKAVAKLARTYAVECDLSLEAHMACGFGVCLGCVVPVRSEPGGALGYERVCVEGPVMPAERLAW